MAWLVTKNIYQKDMCYNKFGLRAHNIDTILDHFDSEHNWESHIIVQLHQIVRLLLHLLTDIIILNQPSYIIFFGVQTNHLICYLGRNDALCKML